MLERYQVLDQLGAGATARVFLARRRGTDALCVIKTLHPHLADDPLCSARFMREANLASMLVHEHVAQLLDAGRDATTISVAMELLVGRDLRALNDKLWSGNIAMPTPVAVRIVLDVLSALHYAHELRDPNGVHLGVVHRDVAPKNIIVTYDGRTKLIDFGLARGRVGAFRTAPNMVLGTPHYMSPEQAVGEEADRRADVYGAGAVLYELLSSRVPFIKPTLVDILASVVSDVLPPISSLRPGLPRALDWILARALAKDPEDRFPTAAAFISALNAEVPELCGARPEELATFMCMACAEERRAFAQLLARHPAPTQLPHPAASFVPTKIESRPEILAAVSTPPPVPRAADPRMIAAQTIALACGLSGAALLLRAFFLNTGH